MQRDLKIGLSLAVLLIGVVGALFFRRDDSDAADIPELKMAWEIDQQIMQRKGSHIPYMAETTPPSQSPTGVVPASVPPSTITPAAEPSESDTFETESFATRNPPRAEVTGVLPPTPDDRYPDHQDLIPDHHVAANQVDDPAIGDIDPERPITRYSTSRINTVDAGRSQVLPKRWSNVRDNRVADVPRNEGWKSLEQSDRPNRNSIVPEPIPLPPVAEIGTQEEPLAPKATRKLKPIPITETNKPVVQERFTSGMKTTPRGDETLARRETDHPRESQRPSGSERVYEVQPGDTLERIAYKNYGRRDMVDDILAANSDIISDRNFISIGMKLRLP